MKVVLEVEVPKSRSLLRDVVFGLAVVALGLAPTLSLAAEAIRHGRTLTFDQRVEAQRAIEQVYWSHRIWPKANPGPKPQLAQVMSAEAIRAEVEDYLEKSNALERWWQRPITAEQLQAEMDRMARNTRDGETLQELYRALGNDPFVIAETLARQTLAERLIRSWYANDARFHGDLKAKAEAALAVCASTDGMRSMAGEYSETTSRLRVDRAGQGADENGSVLLLDADAWADHLGRLATKLGATPESRRKGRPSGLEETPEAFVVTAVLDERADEITTASVAWPKRSFDAWWEVVRGSLAAEVASASGTFELPAAIASSCVSDTWGLTREDVPSARNFHTAVWTGTEMIVWGGTVAAGTPENTGGRYNPSTDTWVSTSTGTNVPIARWLHTAVWTGTEMIVWGGRPGTYLNTGGRYNPSTNSWATTSTGLNVPAGRSGHTAVWTGTEMIVWGGDNAGPEFNTGGRYNPSTNSWLTTSTGVNVPAGRAFHTALWTGTQMVVWGGGAGIVDFNTGGRYNPTTDSWTATSIGANVPVARSNHTAVWTGTEMIAWAGRGGTALNTGGRYNPTTDSWTATSTGANVPVARSSHTAVWTGTQMIVWGGDAGVNFVNSGGRYNPTTDAWTVTSTGANVPPARQDHTAVWADTEMIVWGGIDKLGASLNTGGRYNPTTNAWTATAMGANVPAARYDHTAVWTGAEVVVWGGWTGSSGSQMNTGGRYVPSTDTWVATSTGANVPGPRRYHTALWTGTMMIVWGGYDGSAAVNTGGRYDPFTNTWTATSIGTNVPGPRYSHTAVWTGTEMIVWAGRGATSFNTGGRYNPSTDAWTASSTAANVPMARSHHAAVWTGTEMIVWGGDPGGDFLNNGGRYNPSTDVWAATSTGANVPIARNDHTAVWTGMAMIVWGGIDKNGVTLNTGGFYTPSTNAWTATSVGANVPAARSRHTAVWTGTEMIVWGGSGGAVLNNGGRYDASAGTWVATSTGTNVPAPRSNHTAVWTGTQMVVWGGSPNTSSGGRYCVASCTSPATWYQDQDGDGYGVASVTLPACTQPAGYAAIAGDCNDASAAIHPGATEACNGLDDDCDATADNGGNALCDDGNPCTTNICAGGVCSSTPVPAPAEVDNGIRVARSGGSAVIRWNLAAGATSSDVLRGLVSALPVGPGGGDETCFVDDTAAVTATDGDPLSSGAAFWYLVRGENACGNGPYGNEGQHGAPTVARVSATCP